MMLRITPGTVTNSPITGESTKEPVKTIRAGKAGNVRRTCGDLSACFLFLHAELRVALAARLSLRPLSGVLRFTARAHRAAGRDRMSCVIPGRTVRCGPGVHRATEREEKWIPDRRFRVVRNDGKGGGRPGMTERGKMRPGMTAERLCASHNVR